MSDSDSEIILFDLPCKGRNSCWSLNPWKTRFVLNYKGIPYKTQWIEYPDIEPTFKSFGLPPRPKGYAYSIPTIRLNGTYTMDSAAIAAALEERFPTPSLHLEDPINDSILKATYAVFSPLTPEILPQILENVISEGSYEYWNRTRTEAFGKPLDRYRAEDGGEKCWDAAAQPLKDVAAMLKKNGGPFFMGKEPYYADFIWAGFVQFARRASEEMFERLVGMDRVFGRHYEAVQPWMKRDD